MHGAVVWNAETIKLLTDEWNAGKSATQIALMIPNATRNAITGKLHRLGLLGTRPKDFKPFKPKLRDEEIFQETKTKTPRPPRIRTYAAAIKAEVVEAPIDDGSPISSIGIRLMELRRYHCRAILPEKDEDGLSMYCGNPRASYDGAYLSSYCPQHHRVYIDLRYLWRK